MGNVMTTSCQSNDSPSRGSSHFARASAWTIVSIALVLLLEVAFQQHGPRFTAEAVAQEKKQGEELIRGYPNEEFNTCIVQILAHRDRYDGKKVRVEGYAHVRFENVAVYLSKEAADHSMSSNGFWLEFDKKAVPYEGSIGPKEFNNKFVLIEGTFNKNKRGHHSAYQGTIEKIDRIYELKGPE